MVELDDRGSVECSDAEATGASSVPAEAAKADKEAGKAAAEECGALPYEA